MKYKFLNRHFIHYNIMDNFIHKDIFLILLMKPFMYHHNYLNRLYLINSYNLKQLYILNFCKYIIIFLIYKHHNHLLILSMLMFLRLIYQYYINQHKVSYPCIIYLMDIYLSRSIQFYFSISLVIIHYIMIHNNLMIHYFI